MTQPTRTGSAPIGLLGTVAILLVSFAAWQWTRQEPSDPSGMETIRSEDSGQASPKQSPEWQFSSSPSLRTEPLSDSQNRMVKQLNDEALSFYSQGDFETAAERFREALDEKPSDPVLIKNLSYAKGSYGWKLIEARQLHEALFFLNEAVDLNDNEPTFYVGLGIIHYQLKEEENSLEMLKKALTLGSDDPQPYIVLGEIYYGRDELDLAVGYFEKASELQPGDTGLAERLAKARRDLSTQGEFQRQDTLHFTIRFEGSAEYDVAQEITDLLEDAYLNIGQALAIYPRVPITVILYSKQQFTDVTLTPEWSKGLFDGKIRIPIEGIQKKPELLKKVVQHEYVHALIYDVCNVHIPTWLNEGIALVFEGTESSHWDHMLQKHIRSGGKLIPLRQLNNSFLSFSDQQASLAYAQSYSATQYLIEQHGQYWIKELLLTLADQTYFETAFENQFTNPFDVFEQDWRRRWEL